MRHIFLDLSQDTQASSLAFAGFEGEHLETELTLRLPARLAEREGGALRLVFETADGETVLSAPLERKEDAVSLALPASLMKAPRLSVQPVLFGDESMENVIAKAKKASLRVGQSLREADAPFENGVTPVPGLTVDLSLSEESENPVANSAVTAALKKKVEKTDRATETEAGLVKVSQTFGIGLEKSGHLAVLTASRADIDARSAKFYPITPSVLDYAVHSVGDGFYAVEEESKEHFSPALKGVAEGNPIVLGDLSPLWHKIRVTASSPSAEVTVSGKNLLPYPYAETTKLVHGISFTDNHDGTVTANGTATADATFQCRIFSSGTMAALAAGDYFFSGSPKIDGTAGWNMNFAAKDEDGVMLFDKTERGDGFSAHTDKPIHTMYAAIIISAGTTVENLTFYPQIALGTEAMAWEPYRTPIRYTDLSQGVTGFSPTTVLTAPAGVTLSAEYNKDLNKASLGTGGKDGKDGKDGYTPVRGSDYWTEADKAEIRSYVEEAILGGEW